MELFLLAIVLVAGFLLLRGLTGGGNASRGDSGGASFGFGGDGDGGSDGGGGNGGGD